MRSSRGRAICSRSIEQRYVQDESGEWLISEAPGDTLTFGDGPLTVTAYDSYPGEYSVGIIASDLQDRSAAEYATVRVAG